MKTHCEHIIGLFLGPLQGRDWNSSLINFEMNPPLTMSHPEHFSADYIRLKSEAADGEWDAEIIEKWGAHHVHFKKYFYLAKSGLGCWNLFVAAHGLSCCGTWAPDGVGSVALQHVLS